MMMERTLQPLVRQTPAAEINDETVIFFVRLSYGMVLSILTAANMSVEVTVADHADVAIISSNAPSGNKIWFCKHIFASWLLYWNPIISA